MSRIKKLEEIIFALLYLVLFSIVLLGIDKWIGVFIPSRPFETGPDFFPVFLAVAALALLLCILIKQATEYRIIGKDGGDEEKDGFKPITSEYVLMATIPAIFLYIYALKHVGFLLCGLLLLMALQFILGNRSLGRIFLFSVGILSACYLIFIKLLFIQLPRGEGIFEQISLFFY